MAYTYSKIATVTVGSGGSSNIDFLTIPQNYTDLKLILSLRGNYASYDDYINIRFNSDSGANYSNRVLMATVTSTGSMSWSAQTYGYLFQLPAANATANTFGNIEVYIPNYTSSTAKSFSNDGVSEQNSTSVTTRNMGLNAGLWNNTAAIASINLSVGQSTLWSQYSTATLYGIKAEV